MKKNETSSARPAVTSCQFAKLIWESIENLYIFACSFLPFDERKPQVISKLMSENPQITWFPHSSFSSVSFPLWKCDKRSHAAFSGFADFFELLLFMRNLLSTFPSPRIYSNNVCFYSVFVYVFVFVFVFALSLSSSIDLDNHLPERVVLEQSILINSACQRPPAIVIINFIRLQSTFFCHSSIQYHLGLSYINCLYFASAFTLKSSFSVFITTLKGPVHPNSIK